MFALIILFYLLFCVICCNCRTALFLSVRAIQISNFWFDLGYLFKALSRLFNSVPRSYDSLCFWIVSTTLLLISLMCVGCECLVSFHAFFSTENRWTDDCCWLIKPCKQSSRIYFSCADAPKEWNYANCNLIIVDYGVPVHDTECKICIFYPIWFLFFL